MSGFKIAVNLFNISPPPNPIAKLIAQKIKNAINPGIDIPKLKCHFQYFQILEKSYLVISVMLENQQMFVIPNHAIPATTPKHQAI